MEIEFSEIHTFVFLEFLSAEESTDLKKVAKGYLSVSGLGLGGGKTSMVKRTSKQTWVKDLYFSEYKNETNVEIHYQRNPESLYNTKLFRHENSTLMTTAINKRISLLSQLNIFGPHSTEAYQVANYGLGGQYGLHYDPFGFQDGEKMGMLLCPDQSVRLMRPLRDC